MRIYGNSLIFTRSNVKLLNKRVARSLSLLALCLLVFSGSCAHSKTFQGTVVRISDGDTITVLRKKTPYKVRLEGIDCPEKGQPFGRTAKQFSSQRAFGQRVKVQIKTKDRYQRIVGTVFLPDGSNLSEELLKNGLAWHFTRYSKNTHLQTLEDLARKAKVGLWGQPPFQAPWEYRRSLKQHRKEKL